MYVMAAIICCCPKHLLKDKSFENVKVILQLLKTSKKVQFLELVAL